MPREHRDQVLVGIPVVVDRLDGEDAPSLLFKRVLDDLALLPYQLLEMPSSLGSSTDCPDASGKRPVVVPDAAKRAQPDRSGLPPAVERGPHSVEINKLVGVHDGSIHFHVPATLGVAEMDKLLRIFGIMAVQLVVPELENDPAPKERLHLGAGQLPVETLRKQKRDVSKLDTHLAKFLDNHLDGRLTKVRPLGLEVRPGRIVESNSHFR